MQEFIQNNSSEILTLLVTLFGSVFTFIGAMIKKKYTEIADDKTKKEIVDNTVKYVEQICATCKKMSSEEKKQMAKEKAINWLAEKKINVSDTELDILIEAAVNGLQTGLKKDSDNSD